MPSIVFPTALEITFLEENPPVTLREIAARVNSMCCALYNGEKPSDEDFHIVWDWARYTQTAP